MIVAMLVWLPVKVIQYGLRAVVGNEDSDDIALYANQAIAEYINEHPL
jgi:hypothetical protein